MAWLCFVFVMLVFYTPLTGLPSRLVGGDLAIHVSSSSYTIPFSGSYRLLLYSLLAWFVLWRGTLLVEQWAGIDLLSWLRLPRKWVYATRPPFSGQLARYLAKIALLACLIKLLGPILLGGVLEIVLSPTIEYLTTQVSVGPWGNVVARWLQDVLMNLVRAWIGGLMTLGIRAPLMSFSVLVLAVFRAHAHEQRYRCQLDLERSRRKRKEEQTEIVVPSVRE